MDQVTMAEIYSRLSRIETKIDKISDSHSDRIGSLEQARARIIGMALAGSTLVSTAIAFWSAK